VLKYNKIVYNFPNKIHISAYVLIYTYILGINAIGCTQTNLLFNPFGHLLAHLVRHWIDGLYLFVYNAVVIY